MTVKVVNHYTFKSEDGKEFPSRNQAQTHEDGLPIEFWFQRFHKLDFTDTISRLWSIGHMETVAIYHEETSPGFLRPYQAAHYTHHDEVKYTNLGYGSPADVAAYCCWKFPGAVKRNQLIIKLATVLSFSEEIRIRDAEPLTSTGGPNG